ncbi:MAG TPA: ATP-binding protein [Polyangia bacterium]|jgi:signal transduction histidine kinase|nr:ATP-binding protein [Polyangia bacterium]
MPRGLLSRLIISFVLAIVCFCGSTIYSSWISRALDDEALAIAASAVPAIEHLSNVRAELRRLDTAVLRYEAHAGAPERGEVLEARAQLDEAFERYLSLPSRFGDEQTLWAELHHRLAEVDRIVAAKLEDVDNGTNRYDDKVKLATDAAAEPIRRIIDFNAQKARDLALRMEHGRRRNVRVALLLDLLSTLFTLTAAWLAVRALSSHHRVVDERNRLVARRAEELELFAGRVAHDVLGPLSSTRLAVGLAATRVEDPTVQRALERGQRGITRVATIVEGLLRFARAGAQPDAGAVTPLPGVIEGVVTDLEGVAAEAGVTLHADPVPHCAVAGNAGVLVSVVENLTRNAIKYMGERPVRTVDLRVSVRGTIVRLEVQDSGPGIAPALLHSVFDPHVRGRTHGQPGIGLGLATVKRIVESHGGSVGVQSKLEEGSLFWCELPRAFHVDDSSGETRVAGAHKAESPK